MHGPTSILCSRIAPTSCSLCSQDSRDSSPNGSPLSSQRARSPASLAPRDRQQDGAGAIPSSVDYPTASTAIEPLDSPPASAPTSAPRIEDHPWFVDGQRVGRPESGKFNRLAGSEGDTCSSCRLTLPEDVSKQLPPGSPGTLKNDGTGRNGSPVLRSREAVHSCQGNHFDYIDDNDESNSYSSNSNNNRHSHDHARHSSPNSTPSSYSSSDSSCHTHIVTYLSMHGPANPADYSLLRRASIRTLSCELLPRGLSSGPLSFGDPVTGYTVAYVFRLPDPMARGKRRSYALVALAGKDAGRTFRASPLIWRVFGRIANGIVSAAEKHQEMEKRRDEGPAPGPTANATHTRNYTPVSSFLTGRTLDPDGQPRRAGQIRARNLTEIVGNEFIFAELHAQFVGLLQQLSAMFGGRPISDDRSGSDTSDDASESYASSDPATSLPVNSNSNSNKHNKPIGGHGRSQSTTLQPSAGQTPTPKPIPISQRRQVVA